MISEEALAAAAAAVFANVEVIQTRGYAAVIAKLALEAAAPHMRSEVGRCLCECLRGSLGISGKTISTTTRYLWARSTPTPSPPANYPQPSMTGVRRE